MTHRPLLALGATALLAVLTSAAPAKAQPVPSAAQPSPTAPVPLPPPNAPSPGPGTAPPGGSWGAGIPGTPAPYPAQSPGYGPGAVPPGSPPQGPMPPAGAPPNSPPPGAGGQNPYQPGTLWLSNSNDPMLMGPDGALHQLPLEMPYDKDKGIPPGYKLFEKPRYKLAATGGGILAGLWLVSCVAGGFMQADADRQNSYIYDYNTGYYGSQPYQEKQAWPMFLPVIGPFIAIGTDHTDGAGTGILIVDGVAQTAMGAMFLAGLFTSEKILKFQFQGGAELALHPMAAPMDGGGFAGVHASF